VNSRISNKSARTTWKKGLERQQRFNSNRADYFYVPQPGGARSIGDVKSRLNDSLVVGPLFAVLHQQLLIDEKSCSGSKRHAQCHSNVVLQ
jgi:hypothetical protein